MTRMLNVVFGVVATLTVVLGAVVLGLASLLDASADEVARVPAPSGNVDAVLVETNGGATTSYGYEVYLVPAGVKPSNRRAAAFLYGASRNDSAYGANLRWASSNQLNVEFAQARSAELKQPQVSVANQVVRVVLLSGINDPTAPSGGMLHNVRGSK